MQDDRALRVRARPTTGRYEPTLLADSVKLQRLTLGFSRTGSMSAGNAGISLDMSVSGVRVDWQATGAGSEYLRATVDAAGRLRAGAGHIVWHTLAAGVSAGDVPVQAGVYFGGPLTGPGYEFHSLAGRSGLSQRIEWQSRVPFLAIDLGRFGRVPSSLVVAPWAHATWLHAPDGGAQGWFPSVGLGAIGLFDLLRVDVGRSVGSRGGRWLLSIDVDRQLWPVL